MLVTGAGGFIGSHLVERLLRTGAKVRAFVRYNSRNDLGYLSAIEGTSDQLEIVAGDIGDMDAVRGAVAGADAVFHLASLVGIPYSYQHPGEVFAVNTFGTLNVLTACRENDVGRLVQTSTSEVYGTAKTVPISEQHAKQAQSPYSASKIAADAIATSYHLSYDLPVAICRPFNTYGPRQSDRAIIPTLIAQAMSRDEVLVGDLTPTRDFTYVSDTVDGFIRVAESDACIGQEVNLGTGSEITIGHLVERIVTLVGREVEVKQAEERMRPATSEVRRLLSDNRRAWELAGWAPAVDLDTGLQATIDWMSSSRDLYQPDRYRI